MPYLYVLVFVTNWFSIGYLYIQSSGFFLSSSIEGLHTPINCLVEEVLSKSGIGYKGIPHWQCNIQYLRVYVVSFEAAAKDKV